MFKKIYLANQITKLYKIFYSNFLSTIGKNKSIKTFLKAFINDNNILIIIIITFYISILIFIPTLSSPSIYIDINL